MAYTPIEHGQNWGTIRSIINDNTSELFTTKADASELDNYYQKSEYVVDSSGVPDAGKPIVLDSTGKISASMLDVSVFYYVGPFTPVDGNEYPDTTNESHGAFWVCEGVDPAGYTFTSGDLQGKTIENGDFMVWAAAGWSIMQGEMNPLLYYKLDGSQPLTADFQAGGFVLKNVGDGSEDSDGVNLGQLNSEVATRVAKSGDTMSGALVIETNLTVTDGTTLEARLLNNTLEFKTVGDAFVSKLQLDDTNGALDFKFNDDTSLTVNNQKAPSTKYAPTETNSLVRKDYVDTTKVTRIDLTGQVQTASYRRSVIALCELTNDNPSLSSFSVGEIIFKRANGTSNNLIRKLEFGLEKAYNLSQPQGWISVKGQIVISDCRLCTFTYNGVKYGGIEFFFADPSSETVVFQGETNFGIFGVDYYDTQNDVALIPEIDGSLAYDDIAYVGDLFTFNEEPIALESYVDSAVDLRALAGNAGVNSLRATDTRDLDSPPSFYGRSVSLEFKDKDVVGIPTASSYVDLLTVRAYNDPSGSRAYQLGFSQGEESVFIREGLVDESGWEAWRRLLPVDLTDAIGSNFVETNCITVMTNNPAPPSTRNAGIMITLDAGNDTTYQLWSSIDELGTRRRESDGTWSAWTMYAHAAVVDSLKKDIVNMQKEIEELRQRLDELSNTNPNA